MTASSNEWTLVSEAFDIRLEAPSTLDTLLGELELVLEDFVGVLVPAIAAALTSQDDQVISWSTEELIGEIGRESELEATRFDSLVAEIQAQVRSGGRRITPDDLGVASETDAAADRSVLSSDEDVWTVESVGRFAARLRAPARLLALSREVGVSVDALVRVLIPDISTSLLGTPEPVTRSTRDLLDEVTKVGGSQRQRFEKLVQAAEAQSAERGVGELVTREDILSSLRAQGFMGRGWFRRWGCRRCPLEPLARHPLRLESLTLG
jgi:hypothetical protein